MIKFGTPKFYIALGIFLLIFAPPFIKYQELRYKDRKLAEEIIAVKSENKRLESEKKKLETDIVYVEKRAREKIGLVRRGEIIIKGRPKQ